MSNERKFPSGSSNQPVVLNNLEKKKPRCDPTNNEGAKFPPFHRPDSDARSNRFQKNNQPGKITIDHSLDKLERMVVLSLTSKRVLFAISFTLSCIPHQTTVETKNKVPAAAARQIWSVKNIHLPGMNEMFCSFKNPGIV